MYSNIHKLIDFYVIFLRYPKENNMRQIRTYSSINETQISEKTTLPSNQEQKGQLKNVQIKTKIVFDFFFKVKTIKFQSDILLKCLFGRRKISIDFCIIFSS